MQIAMAGLGRMGMNMARRLISGGHDVVAYNRSAEKVEELLKEFPSATGAASLDDAVAKLDTPRLVWLMLPAGDAVEEAVFSLKGSLSPGDILVDGGNSFYKDDIRRAKELETLGIHYVDAGVSGGIWGLANGYCTMVGGERAAFELVEPVLKTLAPPNGYMHCGPSGAGHFVKMIHNGIEYAMMEAYGEGFEILKASPYGEELKFSDVAHLWNQGSVVRSWLLELLEAAFRKDPELKGIEGFVGDTGEGRWTVEQAIETGVCATGIAHSLFKRFRSRQKEAFSDKVLAALRLEFGGHQTARKEPNG
ncbi:MAG TPA: decarboxylating 6-phosphogluconate dehydrogenase [bacterium]|nr:decarboxylating 6-phosphogluconate dehydrogenase [bacterium]